MSYQSAFNSLLSNARSGFLTLKVKEIADEGKQTENKGAQPLPAQQELPEQKTTEEKQPLPTQPVQPRTFKPADQKAAESLKQKYEEIIRRRQMMEERRKLLEQQRIDELIDKGEI